MAVQRYKECLRIFSSKLSQTVWGKRLCSMSLCVHVQYRSQNLLYTLAPFTGRSDYGPFIEKGVNIPGMSIILATLVFPGPRG